MSDSKIEKDLNSCTTNFDKGGAWIVVKKRTLEKIYSAMGGVLIGMGLIYLMIYLQTRISNAGIIGALTILLGVFTIYWFGFDRR